jgi:hypothetical protein
MRKIVQCDKDSFFSIISGKFTDIVIPHVSDQGPWHSSISGNDEDHYCATGREKLHAVSLLAVTTVTE